MDLVLFYLFAAVSVIASLFVVGQRNPMYSVLLLIVSFGALAGLYILLDSPFAAVTQIIVYAGAIMVLFLFVVMLLNVPMEDRTIGIMRARPLRIGGVLAVLLVAELAWGLMRMPATPMGEDGGRAELVSSVRQIGIELFQTHAFAFEATSVLILVAMIGAVALAKRRL